MPARDVRNAVVAVAALAAAALAGCGREAPPPGAAPATGPAAAAATPLDPRNAAYPSEHTASGTLALRDGRFSDAQDEVESTLVSTTSGDLDGDGLADAIVVLATSTGGSGIFYDLYALRRAGDVLAIAGPAYLGDRIDLEAVRVERGEVVVDLLVQGDKDPLCCPTLHTSWRFRLVGNLLDEISGQRRVFLRE